jgi:hypothetical protein
MNYINIHTSVIHSPQLKGADPVERATWFMLLGFCVEMENSGRISDCKSWKCRRWQQTVGVMLRELNACSDLWRWDGEDLVVEFYPLDQEQEVKQRRDRARHNGSKGGRPKVTQQEPTSEPTSVSTGKPTSESVKERNGKEGNEIDTPLPPFGQETGTPLVTLQAAIAHAPMVRMTPKAAEHWWHTRNAAGWTKGSTGGGAPRRITSWQSDMATSREWAEDAVAKARQQKTADGKPVFRL